MSNTYTAIRYEASDGVATVTLNRPDVHNAMNEAMRRELTRCFEALAVADDVKAVVVTGAGDEAFSAGADIREFVEPLVPVRFREQRRRLDFRAAMERCPQAILAAINTQHGIRLAILFGSLAAGRERADSDLDLAVDAGHRLTAGEKLALMNKLAERTGRPVDLVDLHVVGEPLLGQILRHGKRLLGGETCYPDLIRRHLFDQADYLPYHTRILVERRRAWIGK